MRWRFAVIIIIWVIEALLAVYAGIGYTILLGYLVLLTYLAIPMNSLWLDSKVGKLVYGEITRPEFERFLREMSHSRSYKITVVITALALLAVSIFMITMYNYKLITLF